MYNSWKTKTAAERQAAAAELWEELTGRKHASAEFKSAMSKVASKSEVAGAVIGGLSAGGSAAYQTYKRSKPGDDGSSADERKFRDLLAKEEAKRKASGKDSPSIKERMYRIALQNALLNKKRPGAAAAGAGSTNALLGALGGARIGGALSK